MFVDKDLDIIKIDTEAIRIRVSGEPYVVYSPFGYQAAVDIWHIKRKRKMRLYLSAKTLATQLESIRNSNDLEQFAGIEFWINKDSDKRNSGYVLSE